jgi:hypothetical protein
MKWIQQELRTARAETSAREFYTRTNGEQEKVHHCREKRTRRSKIDNGFVPVNQHYPHFEHCQQAGKF